MLIEGRLWRTKVLGHALLETVIGGSHGGTISRDATNLGGDAAIRQVAWGSGASDERLDECC
jgi:hypothetical protein